MRWIASLSLAVLLAGSATLLADAVPFPLGLFLKRPPRPLPPVANEAPKAPQAPTLVIEIDDNVQQPKLIVSPSVMPAIKKAGLDDPERNTVVAGMALSASVLCGGLWFAKRKPNILGKGICILAVLGVGWAARAWADLPRPPKDLWTPQPQPAKKTVSVEFGHINIEQGPNGNTVRLVLSAKHLAELDAKRRAADAPAMPPIVVPGAPPVVLPGSPPVPTFPAPPR